MVANMTLGTGFTQMLNEFNIMGTGADMILLGISLIIATAITYNEIRNQRYTNTFGIFMMSGATFFGTGIMTSWLTFGAICIIGVIGIVLSEATKSVRG